MGPTSMYFERNHWHILKARAWEPGGSRRTRARLCTQRSDVVWLPTSLPTPRSTTCSLTHLRSWDFVYSLLGLRLLASDVAGSPPGSKVIMVTDVKCAFLYSVAKGDTCISRLAHGPYCNVEADSWDCSIIHYTSPGIPLRYGRDMLKVTCKRWASKQAHFIPPSIGTPRKLCTTLHMTTTSPALDPKMPYSSSERDSTSSGN